LAKVKTTNKEWLWARGTNTPSLALRPGTRPRRRAKKAHACTRARDALFVNFFQQREPGGARSTNRGVNPPAWSLRDRCSLSTFPYRALWAGLTLPSLGLPPPPFQLFQRAKRASFNFFTQERRVLIDWGWARPKGVLRLFQLFWFRTYSVFEKVEGGKGPG
jgi:hypothetical protein